VEKVQVERGTDMTEADWLGCTDPGPMLQFLRENESSERKMRLLACACCRRIWDRLPDPRSRKAVEVAERFADGLATAKELGETLVQAVKPIDEAVMAAYWTANKKVSGPIWNVFAAASSPVRKGPRRSEAEWQAEQMAGYRWQVALIHEVMGNPFQHHEIRPEWLAWGRGLVRHLAEGIYQEKAFERMGVLGDALEDAGCTDEVLLAHCRQGGEHVRGCWALDAILDQS
jgi:hypothetical protein